MRKILAQTYALRQGAFGHVVVQELADDLVTHSHPQTQFSFWLGGGRCEAHLGNVLVKYGEHVALGMSVFEWFETDGLISQRRDWLIGFKV
jgi:hypothetical protein